MPAIIPVIAAVAAAAAVEAAAITITVLGVTISTSTLAAVVGLVVSVAASMLVNSLTAPKKQQPLAAQQADRSQSYRSSVGPRTVTYGKALVAGPICFLGASGSSNEYLHYVLPLADHVIAGVDAVWINDQRIAASDWGGGSSGTLSSGTFSGLIRVRVYDGTQTAADSDLVSESGGTWPSTSVGYGVAYLYLRLSADRDKFSAGLQNVAAEIRGKADILDPRDSSVGYTNNWALCVLDYMQAGFGMRCAADELDDAFWIAAANLSDEAVAIEATGTITQARYTCDGSFGLDEKRRDVLARLLTAGAGSLTYVQGRYRLHGGAYEAPSDTFSGDDVDRGPVQLTTATAGAAIFNAVQGTFVNPAAHWQAMPFPAVYSTTYDAEDGERIWQSIEFRFTTDATRAQRLARMMLKLGRLQRQIKAPVRYAALRYAVHQTLAVTMDEFALTSAPYTIVGWSFDPATKKISLVLQETSAAAYAWDWDHATDVPAPVSAPVASPLSIPAPTGLAVAATTTLQADGGVAPALLVTWATAAHPFVRSHEVQSRLASGPGAWNSLEVPTPTTRAALAPVLVGVSYDVRVRAVTGLARGAWTSNVTGTGAPDTTAPGVPSGFAVLGVLRGFALRWTKATDPDLDVTEVEEATAGTWYKIGETRADTYLRQGYTAGNQALYRLRSRDASGNLSAYCTPSALVTVPAAVTNDISVGAVSQTNVAGWTGSYSGGLTIAIAMTVGEVGYSGDLIVQYGINGGDWQQTIFDVTNYCELRLDGVAVASHMTQEGTKMGAVRLAISGLHTVQLYFSAFNNGNAAFWGFGASTPRITSALVITTFLKR